MRKLSKNEWIAVAVTLVLAIVFFGPTSTVFSLFTSTLTSPALSSADSAEEVKSNAPIRISGERPGDLFILDFVTGEGTGLVTGDTAVVHYVGLLDDGRQFDTSRNGEPFSLTLGEGEVIEGWEQGLLGMKEGGKRRLIIPPNLAYGPQGFGPIPPNATLIFDIELLEIK